MPFCRAPCQARTPAPYRAIPPQAEAAASVDAPLLATAGSLLMLTYAGSGEQTRVQGRMEAKGQKGGYEGGYMISPLISPPSMSIKWLYSAGILKSRSVGRTARQNGLQSIRSRRKSTAREICRALRFPRIVLAGNRRA